MGEKNEFFFFKFFLRSLQLWVKRGEARRQNGIRQSHNSARKGLHAAFTPSCNYVVCHQKLRLPKSCIVPQTSAVLLPVSCLVLALYLPHQRLWFMFFSFILLQSFQIFQPKSGSSLQQQETKTCFSQCLCGKKAEKKFPQ